MGLDINILNTYYMLGLWEGLSPVESFFKDRYFPTGAGDLFKSDKILCEYRDGDHMRAPFMVDRAEPIAIERRGYELHEYEPTKIAQKAALTIDDIKKRGFGEAILSDMPWDERQVRLVQEDIERLERRFARTEEWLCAQTMINNGFTVDEMIDKDTVGNQATVQFYDAAKGNDGQYTIAQGHQWNANGVTFRGITSDVRAMCRGLKQRGLQATDLVVGVDVADALLENADFRELVNKQSGIIIGQVEEELSAYDGVTLLGVINFAGNRLNVITVDEQYKNDQGQTVNYFPATSAMVTAPGCGHRMYGQITVMNESGDFDTIAAQRVPSVFVDRRHKTREMWLESRPFAAPKDYAPWVYAANAV